MPIASQLKHTKSCAIWIGTVVLGVVLGFVFYSHADAKDEGKHELAQELAEVETVLASTIFWPLKVTITDKHEE